MAGTHASIHGQRDAERKGEVSCYMNIADSTLKVLVAVLFTALTVAPCLSYIVHILTVR
jgi:hypothetical protein